MIQKRLITQHYMTTTMDANKMLILYTPDVIHTIAKKKERKTRLQEECNIDKLEKDGPKTLTE